MMSNAIGLMTFVILAFGISKASAVEFCLRTRTNCEGISCNKTIPCEHGGCTVNGWCQCEPCWKGISCDMYVDQFPPIFLKNTEEIFANDPWATEPIYTAQAYDEDLGTTCSAEDNICECAKMKYSVVPSLHDDLFFLNNNTGDVYIMDGGKFIFGQTYSLFLSVYPGAIQFDELTNQSILELRIVFNDFYGHLQNDVRNDRFPLANEDIIVRDKRQIEEDAASTEFDATKLLGDEGNMRIGSKLEYQANMMIPQTGDDGLDMTVEFFTKDIENPENAAVLCVFNAIMEEPPPGVTVTDLTEEMLLSDQLNSTAYDRIIVKFIVKNTNAEKSSLKWKCSVTQVRNPSTDFRRAYLFNVGVEYFKETYIWVAQFPIIVTDYTDETKAMEWVVEGPSEIPLDSAGVFLIKAYTAIRSDNLIFEVIANDNDVVSVGNLGVKDFEVNYDPVPQNIYYYNTTMTGSDEEYIYSEAKLDLGVMTNVGDYTGPEEDGNLITLTYAIYALNIEENIDKEVPYVVNFYIAEEKFKFEEGKVKIIAREEMDKTIESRNISWILTTPTAAQGDMVMYQIWSNLTNGGYGEFVLQVTVPKDSDGLPRLEPCSARLWNHAGNFDVPFLNTTFIDPELEGDKYVFKFDRMHITDQRDPAIYEDSIMIAHLVIKVSSLEANALDEELALESMYFGTQGNPDQEITVGGIVVKENEDPQLPELTAANAVEWEDLYLGSSMVLNVSFIVPKGYGYSDTIVEISGARDPPEPGIRVCRAELTEVEKNLPCLKMHQDEVNTKFTTYKMSDTSLTEPDIATLVLGDVGALPVEEYNKAVVSYIFELPVSSMIQEDDIYSINSGIHIRSKLLKEFTANYTMKTGPPPNLAEDKAPEANCTLVSEDGVLPGHVAEVLIHVHTKIQTISSYSIEIEAANGDTCMAGIKVIDFGRNLPCVDIDTEPFYELHENELDGNKIAGLKFPALSNVGFQANPEHDVLVVKGFVRLSAQTKEAKVDIKWRVVYGGGQKEDGLSINVDQEQDPSSKIVDGIHEMPIFQLAYPDTTITIGSPAVVDFELSLKNDSMASIMLSIASTDSSEKKGVYDVCLGGIWFRGKNYPCFSPLQVQPTFTSSDAGNGHNDTASYNLGVMCRTFFHEEVEEDKVIMRVAMRATDDGTLSVGDSFEIQSQIKMGESEFTYPLKFTIAEEASQIEKGLPSVKPVQDDVIEIGVRQRKWIAFSISIPADSILKVDVKAKAPLKDERAIMTVHAIKLVSGGVNIPCAMLYSEFKVLSVPEVKTTQNDVVEAYLGYFTNLGLTNKTNQAAEGDDDITIQVEVQMSDHPETNHEEEFELVLEAQIGENKLEAKQKLKVIRDGTEKANLDVSVQVDNTKVYQSGESISMTVTVVHNDSSRAEPVNAIVRIFAPPYIQFEEGSAINATNIGEVTFDKESGGLDLVFPQFLFTDTAEVGVTFLSDPTNKRGHGRGEVNATTPYRVLCTQTYRTEPVANPEGNSIISCGPVNHVVYTINSLECYQALGLTDSTKIKDCQLTASSAAKKETGPQNIRMGGDKGWSPALRLGMSNPYLQVDFQQTTRVAGIEFAQVEGTRFVTKYRLQYSYTGSDWKYANDVTELQYEGNKAMNKLEKPVQTRFIRVVVEEAENADEDSKYIGVQMEAYGCFVAEKSESVSCPKEDSTWYSDDTKTHGRHFSVDTERDIAYFCDIEHNANNVLCFSTSDAGNSWRVLPKTFGEVVGFDEESKMTYVIDKRKRAYMASEDGISWVSVNSAEANATIEKDSFVLSHKVPAFTAEDIANLNAKSGKWEATFNGLEYEGKDGLIAHWSKCCAAK